MKKMLIFASMCMPIVFINAYAGTNNILMSKGEWQDPKTKLIWMRCTIGQKWDGKSCSGTGILFTSEDAKEYVRKFVNPKSNYEVRKQWRIPFAPEIASIRTCSKGWYKDIIPKSELTESGRVTTNVEVIRLTQFDDRSLPSLCSDESDHPAINTSIFPNLPKISEDKSQSWQQFYWTLSEAGGGNLRNINIYNGLLGFSHKQDKKLDEMWEKSVKIPAVNIKQYILLVRNP